MASAALPTWGILCRRSHLRGQMPKLCHHRLLLCKQHSQHCGRSCLPEWHRWGGHSCQQQLHVQHLPYLSRCWHGRYVHLLGYSVRGLKPVSLDPKQSGLMTIGRSSASGQHIPVLFKQALTFACPCQLASSTHGPQAEGVVHRC